MPDKVQGLITNHTAGGTIAPYRIVKHGTADYHVLQATAATEVLIGVSYIPDGPVDTIPYGQSAPAVQVSSGERVDIVRSWIFPVEYGGSITRGQWLTSDASGKAIAAAPATGANMSVVGRAEVSGVSGDIGSVHIMPGQIQG
ncbi:MAG TPA: hypothetical protein V6C57_28080 [Coleofasciculaceae cyanobacterium]